MGKANGIYRRADNRWEARYKKGVDENGRARYGSVYGATREEAEEKRRAIIGDPGDARMATELNLLILGAGSHGREVCEVARALRVFHKISFLDDAAEGEDIIGKCKDALSFRNEYPLAFVAIGDNGKRRKYAEFLKERNFLIPTLVSPAAVVSPMAEIGEGTFVYPQGNIGAAKVGAFCIITPNGLVNAEAVVGDYSRIDNGAVVRKGAKVPEGTWAQIGEVVG